MMKSKMFFLAAMAIAGLSGCTQEDGGLSAPTSSSQTIHVVTHVSGIASRGAYETSTLSEFGISIHQGSLSVDQYHNVKMTKVSSDAWTSASEMIWSGETDKIDVIAYAPYQAEKQLDLFSKTDYPVSVKAVQTKDDLSSDFLVFKATDYQPADGSKGGKNVEVNFSHAMSQVNITLTFGTEFGKAEVADASKIEKMKVSGAILRGTCDFTQAEPKVSVLSDAAAEAITPEQVSFQSIDDANKHIIAQYSCLLIPQTISPDDFKVSFTIGDKNYEWRPTQSVTLEQGKAYDLKLTVGKDYLYLDVLESSPWSENGWSDESNLDQ